MSFPEVFIPAARAQGWHLSEQHVTLLFHPAVRMDLHEQNSSRVGVGDTQHLRWVTAVLCLDTPPDSVIADTVQLAFWTENSENMIRTLWGMIERVGAKRRAILRFFAELKTYNERHRWPRELFEQTMYNTRDDISQDLMDELRSNDFETYTLVQTHWDNSWKKIIFNMDPPPDANASTDDGEW